MFFTEYMTFKYQSIPSIVSAFIIIITLYFALKKRKNNSKNNLLCFFLVQLFLYMVFESFIVNSGTKTMALISDRIMYIFVSLIPCTYLHIILIFPEPYKVIEKRNFIEMLIYLPAVVFITLLPTPYMIVDMERTFWGWGKLGGAAFIYFRIFFTSYLICSISLFIHKVHLYKKEPDKKNSVLCLLVSTFPPIILGTIIIGLLPIFNIKVLNIIWTALLIVWFAIASSYTILKEYLFDILALFDRKKSEFHKNLKEAIQMIPDLNSSKDVVSLLSKTFGSDTAIFIDGKIAACKGASENFCKIKDYEKESEKFVQDIKCCGNKLFITVKKFAKINPDCGKKIIGHGVKLIIPIHGKSGEIKGAIILGEKFHFGIYSGKDQILIKQMQMQLAAAVRYIMIIEQQRLEDLKRMKALEKDFLAVSLKSKKLQKEVETLLSENQVKDEKIALKDEEIALQNEEFAFHKQSYKKILERKDKRIKTLQKSNRKIYTLSDSLEKKTKKVEQFIKENKELKEQIDDMKTPAEYDDCAVSLKERFPVKLAIIGSPEIIKNVPKDKRIEVSSYQDIKPALQSKPDVIAFEFLKYQNNNEVFSSIINKDLPTIFMLENRPEEFNLTRPPALTDLLNTKDLEEDIISSVLWLSGLKESTLFNTKNRDCFISISPLMIKEFNRLKKAIKTDQNILICGEAGTGKSLLVQYIKENIKEPFIEFRCTGSNDRMVYNELFGHERGAFDGAHANSRGVLERANNGFIYINEIGSLHLDVQKSIISALENKPFTRIGGTRSIETEIKVLASTNEDIKMLLEKGRLSRDLYHRIAQVEIFLPSLQQRLEDIPLLSQYFFIKTKTAKRKYYKLSKDFLEELKKEKFDNGNVLELINIIKDAISDAKSDEIIYRKSFPMPTFDNLGSFDLNKEKFKHEKFLLELAMKKAGGVKHKAAKIANISISLLSKKIRKFNIDFA